MPAQERLDATRTQVLVIDMQERIVPHINDGRNVAARCRHLVACAARLGLPVSFSEHYPKGLGPTEPGLLERLHEAEAVRLEKITFSAWRDPGVAERVRTLKRRQVLVAGIETHVCVQQTVLDMLRDGLEPIVLADAVGSRYVIDHDTGLKRMARAGACVTTVESVVFELIERADTEHFRTLLPLLREPRDGK